MRIARIARPNAPPAWARLEPNAFSAGSDEGEARLLSPWDRAPWDRAPSDADLWPPSPRTSKRTSTPTGEVVRVRATDLRAPIAPTKIVAIGRNYVAHAKELGHDVPAEPLLFLKPPSAILDPGGVVVRPRASQRVDHEAELAVVIGRRARHVREEDALDFVFGLTVLCDVTARDLQKKDVQFTRAKGFDTFAPVGPWIETDADARDLAVIARVNGVERQHGRTRDMIFPIRALIAYVSAVMTLEPGDVISTGTPEGVGPLVAGDAVEIEVQDVGVLRFGVRDERGDE